jgi:hypothetical protein
MNRLLPVLALAVAAASAAGKGSSSEPRRTESSLTVTTYTPRAFVIDELTQAASSLFGDHVVIDTSDAAGNSGFYTIQHFVQLGDLLLIRDTAHEAARIVATLQSLEDAELARRKAAKAQDDSTEAGFLLELTTAEVRPRYVSLDTLSTALESYQRRVQRGPDTLVNLKPVPEAGFLLVTDTAERLKEIAALVERIDKPLPQMLVTAMLIEAGGSYPLPKEVAASLAELVPDTEFGAASIGVLRCAASSGRQSQIKMDLGGGDGWSLAFFPEAYDPQTGELSLGECKFELRRTMAHPQPQSIQSFTTSLSLRAGEHVVLGAVGIDPTFVVVRFEPIAAAPAPRGR